MVDVDKSWEWAKETLRTEFDRLRAENDELRDEAAKLRIDLELAQAELRAAARDGGILGLCSRCGHREAV